jgi:hypothetical protein
MLIKDSFASLVKLFLRRQVKLTRKGYVGSHQWLLVCAEGADSSHKPKINTPGSALK